jgi:hypothetical protein
LIFQNIDLLILAENTKLPASDNPLGLSIPLSEYDCSECSDEELDTLNSFFCHFSLCMKGTVAIIPIIAITINNRHTYLLFQEFCLFPTLILDRLVDLPEILNTPKSVQEHLDYDRGYK